MIYLYDLPLILLKGPDKAIGAPISIKLFLNNYQPHKPKSNNELYRNCGSKMLTSLRKASSQLVLYGFVTAEKSQSRVHSTKSNMFTNFN